MRTASDQDPFRLVHPGWGPQGTVTRGDLSGNPKSLLRRLAALAIVAIAATEILGCAAAPEVLRENRRAVERPGAFVS